mmetsp:Transcript_65124/g.121382  ORF Transcript_65124/g.121382 Transcript_65124/m.121382 type:complete len:187 (-) Transcript_65124:36-596(-)
MTNRPPLPGTYDPNDWKCPNCKTLNFKKRKSCLACAADKPQGRQEPMKDWRVGRTGIGGNNTCPDWTCRGCGQFNLAKQKVCEKCEKPCPPDIAAMQVEGAPAEDSRTGRGSGHFDRPDPQEERNKWNSDEEDIDEFGRKKKKKNGEKPAAAAAAKTGMSEKQRAALERLQNKGSKARQGSRSRSR